MQSRIERFPPVFCTVLFLLFDLAITCDDTQKHLTRLLTLLYTPRSERSADVDVAAGVAGEKVFALLINNKIYIRALGDGVMRKDNVYRYAHHIKKLAARNSCLYLSSLTQIVDKQHTSY